MALIPKSGDQKTFEEFRPISLYSCLYKIIAKIIAIWIKPILLKFVSREQFGFLDDRKIHKAIGVAQESMRNIKKSRRKGTIEQIYLSKAYDIIIWIYVCLFLTHLGFDISFIDWVMGCITNVSFLLLINGKHPIFFTPKEGSYRGALCHLYFFYWLLKGWVNWFSHQKV